ncbi:MAG: hypothetical protein K6F00_07825 [Lachnospiraceae bacterium]|nr:hypothetical protein [Lachnospiraceae bacterium]
MNLSFREKGISKEVKKRIALLIGVFFASVVFFFFVLNFHVSEAEMQMDPPTLPIINLEAYGKELAPLHGYVKEMDAAYMHDAVVPIGSDRLLPIHITKYNNKIRSLSVELRSLDTSRKIAQTEVKEFSSEEGRLLGIAELANLMEVGQEYILVFNLECGDRMVYYYTRVTIPEEAHTQECVDFALDFSNKARAGKEGEISKYMETKKDVNADTLSYVDIHSTAGQVCWNNFDAKIASDPILEIKDISPGFCVLAYTYHMKKDNDYYFVEEYFRVRYGETRMYLLDYVRRMDKVITSTNTYFNAGKLEIGPLSEEPRPMSNETGTICAFSNMGNLFEFNESRKVMTKVFSFVNNDDIFDERAGYLSHGIRILNIDESGTMDFVVYGYMNSGAHEGECGFDIYHYNSSSNVAKEIAFISTTSPYQILNEGISDLLYRSPSGNIYIMLEGTLFRIDAIANKASVVLDSLTNSQYAVSKSGRYLAWTDKDQASDIIHVMDLSDESVSDIKSEKKELIRPISFMSDDLVYGCIRESDITKEVIEKKLSPMYKICIVQVSGSFGELIKEYSKANTYIMNAVSDSYSIYLDRAKKRGNKFVSTTSDTIMASDGEQNQKVTVIREKNSEVGEMTCFIMSLVGSDTEEAYSTSGKKASLVLRSAADSVHISVSSAETKYYVYVASRIVFSGSDLRKAIQNADDQNGVVVDNHQHYVWRNGKALYKLSADSTKISYYDLGKDKEKNLLDLTGATLDQVLYYVYLGEPTFGQLDKEMVTLVGYNSMSVTIYHPSTGKTNNIGLKDANKRFGKEGNIFFVMHDQNS